VLPAPERWREKDTGKERKKEKVSQGGERVRERRGEEEKEGEREREEAK